MKVAGEAMLGAQHKEVWAALHDPALLARAIPGCESLEVTGPGAARFSVRLDPAAVAGRYVGELTVSDEQDPDHLTLEASAVGAKGTVQAQVTLRLNPVNETTTRVSYEVSGQVGGPIAAAGTRLLASVATRVAEDLFAEIDRRLATGTEVGTEVAAPAAAKADQPAADLGRPSYGGESAATAAARAAARVPGAGRPRFSRAVGVGVALGLGGVIVAAILGRRNGGRKLGD